MNTKIKKIIAMTAGLVLLGATLTGCGVGTVDVDGKQVEMTPEAVLLAIEDAKIAAENSVDITADNELAIEAAMADKIVMTNEEQEARDAMILADYELALKEVSDLEVSAELAKYIVDDISLTGNFEMTIDSDDFEKLTEYEIEYGEDENKYDVEEVLLISSDVAPKLNLKDLDGEVVIEIADEGAMEYKVLFDSEIDIEKDEDLEINFLGMPMSIVSFDDSSLSIKYRMSEKYVGELNSEFDINGKILKIVDIDGDSEKVLIDVDGEKIIVEIDEVEDVLGIQVKIVDAIKGSSFSYVELYAGDKISEEVSNGDEYDADDRFEWAIDGNSDGILSVGLKLVEERTDDDEVMKVGDSIAFPNDYIKVSFDSVKNMELEDVELKVTDDEVRLNFEGKIEVADDKVDDGKITFYMNAGVPTYDYEHNGDDVEGLTDMSDIVMFQDDRELSVNFNDLHVKVYDADVSYKFEYSFANEVFVEAKNDAANVDDDDNFRMNNGDVIYKVDFTEDNVDEVKIGLVNDEGVEVIMSVE